MPGDTPELRKSAPSGPIAPDSPESAVMIFDPAQGRVIALSQLARDHLSLPASETGAGLDGAMPALIRLRVLARKGELNGAAIIETLLFWAHRKAHRVRCLINQPLGGTGVIHVEFELPPPEPPAAPNGLGQHDVLTLVDFEDAVVPEAFDDGPEPPRRVRDDTATLREIGERIRNGMRTSPEIAELAAANDKPALPDYLALSRERHLDPKPRDDASPAPVAEIVAGAAQRIVTAQAQARTSNPVREPAEPAPIAPVAPVVTAPEKKPDPVEPAKLARDEADESVNALLARTAHEIKTPLSAIAAASEVIRDEHLGAAGEHYRAYADGIHANARHALDVVDRLLKGHAASAKPAPDEDRKVEAVENKPPAPVVSPASKPASSAQLNEPRAVARRQTSDLGEPAPVQLKIAREARAQPHRSNTSADLNAMIEAAVRDAMPLAERKGIGLSAWPDAMAAYSVSDATGLKQALFNLVTNALKFTPEGGTVMVETEAVPGNGIALIVRDTGRGMTRAMAARLANPALDPAPGSGTATGHGLGFQQVREFASAQGASFKIDSILSKGTCVTVLFRDVPG